MLKGWVRVTSMTTTYQTKANPEQLDAIEITEGPLLISADPGSHRTTSYSPMTSTTHEELHT
jgi:hypothetical protein